MDLPRQRLLLLPVFLLSGFSALVYEIIWARMLSLVFGSTVEAVSAVVTAFMFGLAAGSYFMGRWADRKKELLSIYALTEAGIGVLSLSFYFLVISIPGMRISFLSNNDTYVYVAEFLLVAVPATLIGATFPLMVRAYVFSNYYIGRGTASVYAINTFGAVLGAFLTGFLLIPFLGMRKTVFLAVSINITLSLMILLIRGVQRQMEPACGAEDPIPDPLTLAYPPSPLAVKSVFFVLALAGFSSMAYQVAWTRLLTLVIGNSVYAFSAMLTTFLAGIAIGSLSFVKLTDWKARDKLLLLGLVQGVLCITVILSIPLLDLLPRFFMLLFRISSGTFQNMVLIDFLVAASAILIPTILMGITFPISAKIYNTKTGDLGEGSGRLYSANTLGCIFGAFLTGFYLIPSIGVQRTIIATCGLNLLGSAILIIQSPSMKGYGKSALTAALLGLYLLSLKAIPAWDMRLLNLGLYYQAPALRDMNLDHLSDEMKLVSYEEGNHGTVAVTSVNNDLAIQINGKTDGGTSTLDMPAQTLVSALPLFIHEEPGDIAVIGLGTGVSVGTATLFPVSRIDCIELLPEVVRANRHFSSFNHHALNDERVNLVIDDARRYLTYTDKKYDVIISEPSNPWINGVSGLFTVEFFEIARNKLKDDGIISQWVQNYSLDTKELKTLLNTFRKVFPHVTVWAPSPLDLVVLGSKSRMDIDPARVGRWFLDEGIRGEMQRTGINNPEDLFSRYLMGRKELRIFCKGADINTDDRPIIQFEAPKTMYLPTAEKNLDAMLSTSAVNR